MKARTSPVVIHWLWAAAGRLSALRRFPGAGPRGSEPSVAAIAAASDDRPGAEEEYYDITLSLILERRRQPGEAA